LTSPLALSRVGIHILKKAFDMISIEQAREAILKKIVPLQSEKISIEQALGRYLAQDVISARDIPPWDNSAMDGYAVHAADLKEEGTRLRIAYEIPAGSLPQGPFAPGTAVKIMTGAPIPPGADAVVKREDTRESAEEVIVHRIPVKGEHIRGRGEDIRKGDLVIPAGTCLEPSHIGLLASVRTVMAYCSQRPVVAIIATGDEVADLDDELTENKISSSNSYTLKALVAELGAVPLYLGVARDTREDLKDKFAKAAKADLILTSGGVSMGDYDIVREVMTEGSNAMEFWKVNMKPGRPLAFGTIGGIPAIGLPGNPLSTMTSFYQFARPAILKFMGARSLLLPRLTAALACDVKGAGDRPQYMSGVLSRTDNGLSASPAGPQGSGILSSLARANCYIVIPEGNAVLRQGSPVECELFGTVR
jgi:molybdopterin molybdotransferase